MFSREASKMTEREMQWNLPGWLDASEPEITIRYSWVPEAHSPTGTCDAYAEDIRYMLHGQEVRVLEDTPLWYVFDAVCAGHEFDENHGAEADYICDTRRER